MIEMKHLLAALLVVGLVSTAHAESLSDLQDEMRHQYNMLQMDIEDMRNELEYQQRARQIEQQLDQGWARGSSDQRLYDEHMSMPRWMRCQTDFTAC